MRVAIIGSRTFDDYEFMEAAILSKMSISEITCIVSGGARGADKMGEAFADSYGITKDIFKPDWDKYGKSAGMIRNGLIINNSDAVIAFWDGSSKGTQDSINKAKKKDKILYVIDCKV